MNYIKKLQEIVKENTDQHEVLWLRINDFLSYLGSDKFKFDTTVQVGEVIRFLVELRLEIPEQQFKK